MNIKKYILPLLLLSNPVIAEPHMVTSLQFTTGQNDLYRSTSLLVNLGLGYQTRSGFYADWVAGMNIEAMLDSQLNKKYVDINQQSLQMDLVAGYRFKVTRNTFLKLGAGIETAIFLENCDYSSREERYICERKHEHGPTYKAGYYFRSRRDLLLGVEYNRDELSETRKYNGISLVVNALF